MATSSLDQETAKAVLRQVEFYFSDSNIPRDHFLKKKIAESEDGLVDLALICSFSKMRDHLKLGSIKPEEVSEDTVKSVAETLKQSSSLKLSEDGKRIGRASELLKPEELLEQLDVKTIAASPFEYKIKREVLETFFNKYGKVNSVRLPRHVANKNQFCGTALVEFSTEEDAQKVLGQSLAYAGVDLELKTKKEFDSEHEKEREKFEKSRPVAAVNNKSNAEPEYPQGLVVAFSLKSKVAADSKKDEPKKDDATEGSEKVPESNDDEKKVEEKNGGSEKVPESNDDEKKVEEKNGGSEKVPESNDDEKKVEEKNGGSEKLPESNDDEKKVEEKNGGSEKLPESNDDEKNGDEKNGKEEMETENGDKPSESPTEKVEEVGVISAAACVKDMNVVMREDLKKVFQKFGVVKFIDFSIGETSGYIRFEEPEGAQKARAAAVLSEEGGLTVKNFIAVLEPVTGDAEKEYWSQIRGGQVKHRETSNKFSRGGRGGRFHRGGKQSRGRDDAPRGRPNKARRMN